MTFCIAFAAISTLALVVSAAVNIRQHINYWEAVEECEE